MTTKNAIVAICLLFSLLTTFSRAESVNDMLKRVGGTEVRNSLAVELRRIHDSLQPIARLPLNVNNPRLMVVDAGDKVFAYSHTSPVPTISVSTAALQLCANQRQKPLAQACMAFIVGHELEHLRANDTANLHGLSAMSGSPESRRLEIKADSQGIYMASLAGYRIDSLLSEKAGEETLQRLFDAGGDSRKSSHPAALQRYESARDNFSKIVDALPLFEFGTGLALLGKCDDALEVLEPFKRLLPSAEVLTNIGACQLRLAMEYSTAKGPFAYWLPLAYHGEISAVSGWTTTRSQGNEEVLDYHLDQAIRTLKLGFDTFPNDTKLSLNYATALFLNGQFTTSRRVAGLIPSDTPNGLAAAMQLVVLNDAHVRSGGSSFELASRKIAALKSDGSLSGILEFNRRLLAVHSQINQLDLSGIQSYSNFPSHIRLALCIADKNVACDAAASTSNNSLAGVRNRAKLAKTLQKTNALALRRRVDNNVTLQQPSARNDIAIYHSRNTNLSTLYSSKGALATRINHVDEKTAQRLLNDCPNLARTLNLTNQSSGYSCGSTWAMTRQQNSMPWQLWVNGIAL